MIFIQNYRLLSIREFCDLTGFPSSVRQFRQVKRFQMFPTAAFLLVPHDTGSAVLACPFLSLDLQPAFTTMFLYELEIRLHRPMVGPLIVHKVVELFAGIITAKAAEFNIPVARAISERTPPHPIIDIFTLAAAAIRCPACTAEQPARAVL
jgi:hypothetical protein